VSHSSPWHFGTFLHEIKITSRDFINPTSDVGEIEGGQPQMLPRTPPNYSGEITKLGIVALAWSCVYINEACKKRHIFFKRFEQLSNALRKAFYSQGSEAKSYWDYFIEEPGIIDSSRAKEIDQAFETLAKLVSMEVRLTAYTTVFLLRSGILSLEALTGALNQRQIDPNAWLLNEKKLPVLATEYNSHFGYTRSRGLISIVTRIYGIRCGESSLRPCRASFGEMMWFLPGTTFNREISAVAIMMSFGTYPCRRANSKSSDTASR
jgi:hypothetical protein